MIYITGDTHRDFTHIKKFCVEQNTTINDTMIILGDACINYMLDQHDVEFKTYLSKFPIKFFCVHGNHEQRPEAIMSYIYDDISGTYYEEEFPNIQFARDGNIYEFNDKEYIVIGGAYSVDKEYRLLGNGKWWANEQPSQSVKEDVEWTLENICEWHIDGVLSHTCPFKYEPIEMFLSGIDQRNVDDSTERWLDIIEERLKYDAWWCGHWHTDKNVDKMHFLFNDIIELR